MDSLVHEACPSACREAVVLVVSVGAGDGDAQLEESLVHALQRRVHARVRHGYHVILADWDLILLSS